MAEQENHNLCVGGSNPSAATRLMAQINEYFNKTAILGDHVNEVSRLLDKNNDNIKQLTLEMELLFALFSRGDELIKIIQDYSKILQQDIVTLRVSYTQYEDTMEQTSDRLLSLSELLKSLISMSQQIQNNADLFVKSAQSLANLSKNTEIRAHHAKKEGKGLAIIAKECLSLAQLAQLPFHDFSALLNNLEQIARPVVEELKKTIELSSLARVLLKQSFKSLKTIDDTTVSLQNIITQLEENSSVNQELKATVSEGLSVLKNQFLTSMNTIDDISVHCKQINSLAQTLSVLSTICSTVKEQTSSSYENSGISSIEQQYNFFLQENITTIGKFSTGKQPPLFPHKIYQSIGNMTGQIVELNNSIKEIHGYKEALGTDMAQIVDLGKQIENFLDEIQNVYKRLNDLGKNLSSEIKKIEVLVSSTGKIFTKIKTLSVFAKIEQGRSSEYKDIISPIVDEFIQLEADTEQAFADIIPQLTLVKKDAHVLSKERMVVRSGKIKPPDYSKIRIFLDDISRVFGEEKEQAEEISKIITSLDKENITLSNAWENYEGVIDQISKASSSFDRLFVHKKAEAPGYIRTKKILTVNLPSDPLTLRPDVKTDVNSHRVICNCSSGLFQFGDGADIIPGLCQNYSVSQDGREYIFRLRENLKYQNGRPIMVEDIRDSIIRALEGPNCSLFAMITGTAEFAESKQRNALGIKIIDSSTLKLSLEYPFLPILANLACDIADPYLDDKLPIGTGPFKLIAWEKGNRIILQANEHYFEGRPTVDELYFLIIKDENMGYELFKKRALSIFQPTGDALKRMRAEMPKSLHTIPELGIQYLCINCRKKPFDNKQVRQALAHAINTNQLVNMFFKGSAIRAKGIFPPSMEVFNHRLEGYKFNPATSKRLLSEAGFPNGLPSIYALDIRDTPAAIKQAEFIKTSLMAIGVRIDINPMPWQNLIERTYACESTLSFRGWVSDNGDPDNFVYPLFHSASYGRPGNTFFFSSPEIDNDIDQARKIRNLNQRISLYRQIEKKILDEAPGVFFFHRLQNLAVQPDILGIRPHPLGLVRTKYVCPLGKRYSIPAQPANREERIANMV